MLRTVKLRNENMRIRDNGATCRKQPRQEFQKAEQQQKRNKIESLKIFLREISSVN